MGWFNTGVSDEGDACPLTIIDGHSDRISSCARFDSRYRSKALAVVDSGNWKICADCAVKLAPRYAPVLDAAMLGA